MAEPVACVAYAAVQHRFFDDEPPAATGFDASDQRFMAKVVSPRR